MNIFPARIEGRTAHATGQTIPLSRDYDPSLGESAIAHLHVGDTLVRARIDG